MPLDGDYRSIAQMTDPGCGDGRMFYGAVCELVAQTVPVRGESIEPAPRVPEGFIPWYTDSIPALTSEGPSDYDNAAALRINMREPVVIFSSKVRSGQKPLRARTGGRPTSRGVRLAHIFPDQSASTDWPRVREVTKLEAELGAFRAHQLSLAHSAPNMPCIHVDSLAISFHRTVRIPDNGEGVGSSRYPPAPKKSLGALHLLSVARLRDQLPQDAVDKGGLITWLHDAEVMRINFHIYGHDMFLTDAKFAVCVFAGGINGLSGEPVRANMAAVVKRLNGIRPTQDYLDVHGGRTPAPPGQRWLDGVAVVPGVVRQFVAVPHGSPESIEAQAGGSSSSSHVGGIQLEIMTQYPLGKFWLLRRDRHPAALRFDERLTMEYPEPDRLEAPADLAISANTRVHGRERGGPARERKVCDELDCASAVNRAQRTVELQVWPSAWSPGSFEVTVRLQRSLRGAAVAAAATAAAAAAAVEVEAGNDVEELSLCVFPETTLSFVKEQAAYPWDLPPEPWTIKLPASSSSYDPSANIRSGGQQTPPPLLVLVEAMFAVGAGARIREHIVPDDEDARSWNVDGAVLVNVHAARADRFARATGLALPRPVLFAAADEGAILDRVRGAGGVGEMMARADLGFGLARIRPSSGHLFAPATAKTLGTRFEEERDLLLAETEGESSSSTEHGIEMLGGFPGGESFDKDTCVTM
ncbi:hypothetical protein B0T24DRAFT_683231 [Lasiosphaeria ovina]|uniref:Uncharacterized protein n=1 Tax=Lasiosphaeria ovina TaxID=92902 RepID=A0AAE0N1N9_9PEZI|nr:hypothetical protein B0T24DRAFT_683231 [Lasiosphaeria ovina]